MPQAAGEDSLAGGLRSDTTAAQSSAQLLLSGNRFAELVEPEPPEDIPTAPLVRPPLQAEAVLAILAEELDGTAAGFTIKRLELQRRWEVSNLEAYASQQVAGLLCAGFLHPQMRCRPVLLVGAGEWHQLSDWQPDIFADLQ